MAFLQRNIAWPLALKVPLLVSGLMVGVAVMISQVVLARLVADQESNLRLLTGAYLDGLSAAVLPAVIRADTWEAFDALDRARRQYAGVEALYAIVELPSGSVLAASDPIRFPVQTPVPQELRQRFASGEELVLDDSNGRAWLARTLKEGAFSVGRIIAEIDTANLLRIRHRVSLTLILVNSALTLAFAAIGYIALKRMLHPLGVLTRHVERARDGRIEPIPEHHRKRLSSEFGQLFAQFNAMARALNERECLAAQLAEQEKYAMLGKLASGMAHEVNNPLGGMLNLVDTLRKHGRDDAIRRRSLDLLERGLSGIGNVVRAALATYKGASGVNELRGRDLDDLKFLLQHEVGRRRLELSWQNRLPEKVGVDGAAVRQIALNLLLNACAASPSAGTVAFDARAAGREFRMTVSDSGPGLPSDIELLYRNPAQVSRAPTEHMGLGVWTVCHMVSRLGGRIALDTGTDRGTTVTIRLPMGREEPLDAVA